MSYVVNTTARRYRIWVCRPDEDESTGFEVTDACAADGSFFSVTDEPLGIGEGRIRTTGELNLIVPVGQESLYNAWNYPNRWAVGNHVVVKVADEAGTLRRHPRSGLYILTLPLPPYPGNYRITLELADALTLNEQKTGPAYPPTTTGIARSVAASNVAAGIDLSADFSIDGTNPTQLNDSGKSPIDQLSEMAIASCAYLYQNAAGEITNRTIALHPDHRLFKHRLGIDDADRFEVTQSDDRPCKITVVSPGDSSGDDEDSGYIYTVDYGPAANVLEGYGGDTIVLIRKETWRWSGNVFTRHIEEQKPRALVIPEAVYDAMQAATPKSITFVRPDAFMLINSMISDETHVYETSKSGRLQTTIVEEHGCIGALFADFYQRYPVNLAKQAPPNFGEMIIAQRSETDYSYQRSEHDSDGGKQTADSDTGGQVRQIFTQTQQPIGTVAGAANDWSVERGATTTTYITPPRIPLETLIVSAQSTQTWMRRTRYEWEQHIVEKQAGQARSGPISSFIALSTTKNEITVSASGNAQPPSADRKRGQNTRKQQIKSEETTSRGSDYSSDRTITSDYLTLQAEADQLAYLLAAITDARQRGFRITSALRDGWFSYAPMSRIDLLWGEKIYIGVTNLVNWTLAGDQAIVLAECMITGSNSATAASDSYPFPDLPTLQPSDPTPDPISDSGALIPGDSTTQSIEIYQNFVRPKRIRTISRVRFIAYPYALSSLGTTAVSMRSINRITFHESVSMGVVNRVTFAPRAAIVAASLIRVILQGPVSVGMRMISQPKFTAQQDTISGLVAYWKLEGSPWLDSSSNGITLTQYGNVQTATGVNGDAAYFRQGSSLQSEDDRLGGNNSHWRFEAKIKCLSTGSNDIWAGKDNDWNVYITRSGSTVVFSATLKGSASGY